MVARMLSELVKLPKNAEAPCMAFDLEGDNLGRNGTTCYLQIRDLIRQTTYLVDLWTLEQRAFTATATISNTTLKDILEDIQIKEIIWDCRQDSDALHAHFGVRLAGVLDIQYLAMLSKSCCPSVRPPLRKAISEHANLSEEEEADWCAHKSYAFNDSPEGYAIFMDRPLPQELKAYAVNDVKYLQNLYDSIRRKVSDRGEQIAIEWLQEEVEDTWKDDWCSTRHRTRIGFETCWDEDIHVLGYFDNDSGSDQYDEFGDWYSTP